MTDIFLALVFALTGLLGYGLMKRLDRFLNRTGYQRIGEEEQGICAVRPSRKTLTGTSLSVCLHLRPTPR